jgi:hypothetical protein
MNSFNLKLLDFRLPDFTRYAWVSDTARNVWQPRINNISACLGELEWLSVAAGLRECALKIIPTESLPELSEKMQPHGLFVAPLNKVAALQASYAALQGEAIDGEPCNYRVVVGSRASVEKFQSAWSSNHQTEVGTLLGYPACCSRFFEQVWCRENLIDTTWPMAVNTKAAVRTGQRSVVVEGAPQANILLRWLGLRAVFHLPCRFDCEATITRANKLLALGRESGYGEEIECLTEALSWPVEWSALHGIAEIKTPVLKLAALTDTTAEKYVVHHQGSSYPQEGARGLFFPYNIPHRLRVSDSKGFQRGIRNPIEVTSIQPRKRAHKPEWYCTDNGFASESDMNAAHKPLVDLAVCTLAGRGGAVLDLGCGNGALLRKIRRLNPGAVPFGVDIDPAKLAHARLLLSEFDDNLFLDDIFETDALWPDGQVYALVILMPGRLLEVSLERAEKLKSRLREHASNLIVYSYDIGDEGLPLLAEKVGIQLLTPAGSSHARLARIP